MNTNQTVPIEDLPDKAARRRIKELEVMVSDVVVETPDTTTLVFFTGNDHLEYQAGHFLTIDPHQFEALERFTAFLEDLKGRKEPPRAYSMCSAPHEKRLAVTVTDEVSAAPLAFACQANRAGNETRCHGIHRSLHATGQRRVSHGSCHPHLRRLRKRPQFLHPETCPGESSKPSAYVRLLEQDMGGCHFSR